MRIVIDHERFGVRSEFATLAQAQAAIRECGPEFAGVTLEEHGCDVMDDRGEVVGRVCMPMLEVCSNAEWLRENGFDSSGIDEAWHNEAASHFYYTLRRLLEDAGFNTERARGQRITYHGWNGANLFKHKIGPVGTFDTLNDEQQGAISSAIAKAEGGTRRVWGEGRVE